MASTTPSGNIFQIRLINQKQTINSNRWSIRFVGLRDLLAKASRTNAQPWIQNRYDAVKEAFGSDPSTELELSLFNVTLPSVSIDTVAIPRFNDTIKAVTKFTEMEDLTINFYDYVEGSASAIMQMWHAFVGDKSTGAIGFKRDFVLRAAQFFVYGPDAPGYNVASSADIPWLQRYELVNLFPKAVKLGEHGDGAEPRKVEVTFAVDNVYPTGIRTYVYNADGSTGYTEAKTFPKIPYAGL